MSIPGSVNPLFLGAAGQSSGYQIERSLRFNSADSAYLSRTPASAGNRKTWTWAGWVKRSALDSFKGIFSAGSNNSVFMFVFDYLSYYEFNGSAITSQLSTTQVFRDPSAWYHVVLAVDTTQATASNRNRFYVNGAEVTALSTTTYPSQNSDTYINSAIQHNIGYAAFSTRYFDGYLAEIHFIDGQALTPTSFGEFDATTGIWQPKAYTGTYGTNGFRLNFSDNSTAAALGTDTSGNGNTWTVNNLSVTAGSGNDSLVDTPTSYGTDTGVGGEVRGNYCTWNPLNPTSVGTAKYSLANGNLEVVNVDSAYGYIAGTMYVTSGKWYWEIRTTGVVDPIFDYVGIVATSSSINYPGSATNAYWYKPNGNKVDSTGYTGFPYGASWTSADTIGVALDLGAGEVIFYKNGVSQGVAFTGITASAGWTPAVGDFSNTITLASWIANFGQRPFAYAAPSGFKALNTANLPAPLVTKPSDLFDVKLYTGNGSTQTISGLGFSPDLVWIKNRAAADNHKLTDIVRGATEELESNTTDAEATNADGLTQFNADGFDLGDDDEYNTSAEAYVAWAWDAGSSTVSNTDGSISSQVRANASAGFSVVTYTGIGTAGTIGHGLGAAPQMIIVKNRDAADAWQVYHSANTANPETDYLVLNTTAATADALDRWNDTAPTSTVFSLGDGVEVNTNTEDYVAYCWTGLSGYSAFGSYTGNGSADGSFTYLGFLPKLILIKRTDTTSNWTMLDTLREGYNVDNDPLYPNLSDAEGTTDLLDITSNGFKLRTTDASVNASGGTYIYFAIAEAAFNYGRAR